MSHSFRRRAAKVALVAAALACLATSPVSRDRNGWPGILHTGFSRRIILTAELPRTFRLGVRLSTNEAVTAEQVEGSLGLDFVAQTSGAPEASVDAGTSPGRSVHMVLRGADGTLLDESVMALDRSSVGGGVGAEALTDCSGTACEDSFTLELSLVGGDSDAPVTLDWNASLSTSLDESAGQLDLELVE